MKPAADKLMFQFLILNVHHSSLLKVIPVQRTRKYSSTNISKVIEMIIFEEYRLLERLVGLNSLGGRERIFVRIIYAVSIILMAAMELTFFTLNIRDGIDRAMPALTSLCGSIPTLACYGHLLINRQRYHSILNQMQNIVTESA